MRQLLAFLVLLPSISFAAKMTSIYQNPSAPISDRVSDLVSHMTLQEKVDLVGGNSFSTKANARLGIPELKMTDGPIGVRWGKSTAFPSGISMGAAFNRDLVYQMASAMGVETRAHGRDMLLGPCVGLSRIPFGGRNFESMGEDPFLTAELVASYTHALNDQKVVGSVKHFGLNDQEYKRMTINSVADERTMHELHFVPFERAVREGMGTVMSSYNKLNGLYASENYDLLTGILKKQWGFTGFVVSDWGATHSTVPSALAGLDLEMPTPEYFGPQLLKAVQDGQVSEALMNDKVSRILGQIFRVGLFDGADSKRPAPTVINSEEHKAVALQLARESMVLLKNEKNLLPLNLKTTKKIAVIGPNADVYVAGGGSSMVVPASPVTVMQGMHARVGARAQVGLAPGVISPGTTIAAQNLQPSQGGGEGLYAEYFNNKNFSGEPTYTRVEPVVNFYYDEFTKPVPGVDPANYSVRWTGMLTPITTGDYEIQTTADDGVRLWINDQLVIDNWMDHGSVTDTAKVPLQKGQSYKIRLEYYQSRGGATIRLAWTPPSQQLMADAVALAAQADVVILSLGFNSDLESEGNDRSSIDLPVTHLNLIDQIAAVNPKLVVVINSGNPVAMESWLAKVPALIYAWYPGEQGGNALADIVLGDYNPSGRLPVTMLKRWEDSPAYGTYPEQNGDVVYKEGVFVGYRHFDTRNVAPLFPFGYGMSYTKFVYSNLNVRSIKTSASAPQFDVTVNITNTGDRSGAEVVQLYVQDQSPKVERPLQELKGFEKVILQPGETRAVTFHLDQRAFAYYDVMTKDWKAEAGRYSVRVGASSRDIRMIGDLTLSQ